MEKTNKKVLIIAIILAVVTSFMVFGYIKKVQMANENIKKVKIVVAARTIEPRTTITPQDLKEIEVEQSFVNKNALNNKEEIINKVTKEKIFEGEQIISERLANDKNDTLSFEIPKGKRAVTINVREASAVGYFVNPGDYVDVVVTVERESLDQPIPTTTRTLLQNVLVLGVGQQRDVLDMVKGKTEKKTLGSSSADANVIKTVTLAVLPQDVEKISMAEQVGSIRLSLRPVGEEDIIYSEGVTRDNLLR